MWKIPLFDLDYDAHERKAVNAVLEGKWLSMGAKTEEFEDSFVRYLGNDIRCCAVANGTAALHLSLLANNIGIGDEVIISALTFVACLNVITLLGATPVLADSESLDDWNVSPKDIARKVTPKTKAIIIVHYAGYPCDMNEIIDIAKRYNLVLIEDAAHAVGADYRGRKCGTIGDIGCFSFFSNKNLSTGEGGMISTKNKALYEKFRLMRSHGMTSMTTDRHVGKSVSYDVVSLGLNYRIDEIRAALGIEQLKKLDRGNHKREILTKHYHKILSGMSGIIAPWSRPLKDIRPSYHILPVLLPKDIDRGSVMERMKSRGIQTSIHYPSFSQFSFYKNFIKRGSKVAEEISQRAITLPLYPLMKIKDVDFVCQALKGSIYA